MKDMTPEEMKAAEAAFVASRKKYHSKKGFACDERLSWRYDCTSLRWSRSVEC